MKENSCPWSLSRPKYFYKRDRDHDPRQLFSTFQESIRRSSLSSPKGHQNNNRIVALGRERRRMVPVSSLLQPSLSSPKQDQPRPNTCLVVGLFGDEKILRDGWALERHDDLPLPLSSKQTNQERQGKVCLRSDERGKVWLVTASKHIFGLVGTFGRDELFDGR